MPADAPTSLARRSSHDIAGIHADLRRDGGVVVQGLLTPGQVAEVHDEIQPHVDRREPGFRDDEFYGRHTVRVQGLAAKSAAFVESVLLHPTLLAVADAVLLPHCGHYWLSQAETIYIRPGNAAQPLHRDDVNWSHAAHLGIDLQLSALVALGDYDAEVGATMVVPRSHLDPYDAPIDGSLAIPVEMQPGDALLYTGSLAHGGGANTSDSRVREALYIGYLLGWLTPEEAVVHSVSEDLARTLPEQARTLLGWANLHGNAATAGVEAATQLWQLDRDRFDQYDGTFLHR
ncbi:MAG: phytanoyl-CoA dioxygenase family protein [Actinomycetota bacterium]